MRRPALIAATLLVTPAAAGAECYGLNILDLMPQDERALVEAAADAVPYPSGNFWRAEKDGAVWAVKNDPRVTKIGAFIRKVRIDELPQLFHILLGEMSFIGPRPLLPIDQPEDATVRLLVRPGLTGRAQVQGGRAVSPEEKAVLDEWYVRNAVPLHLAHLEQRARQSGDWDGPAMLPADFLRLLQQRIDTLDIDQARADVRPFLRDARALEIWSPRYFRDLADKVAYV